MDPINKIKQKLGIKYNINYPLNDELKQKALNHGLIMTHMPIDANVYKLAKKYNIDIERHIKNSFNSLKEIEKQVKK